MDCMHCKKLLGTKKINCAQNFVHKNGLLLVLVFFNKINPFPYTINIILHHQHTIVTCYLCCIYRQYCFKSIQLNFYMHAKLRVM